MCCRYVTCRFGKDQDKSTQVRRGGAHNCRIDETVVLDVTGDQQTGQLLAIPMPASSRGCSFCGLSSVCTTCGKETGQEASEVVTMLETAPVLETGLMSLHVVHPSLHTLVCLSTFVAAMQDHRRVQQWHPRTSPD